MNGPHTRTAEGKGAEGRLQRSCHPPEPAGPAPLPLWPRASCRLDDIQTKVCVLFSGFRAWGCSAGADHQGESCAHRAPWSGWSRKGTPGVILGILLPLTRHALSVISLRVHRVRSSEAAGARRAAQLNSEPWSPTATLAKPLPELPWLETLESDMATCHIPTPQAVGSGKPRRQPFQTLSTWATFRPDASGPFPRGPQR